MIPDDAAELDGLDGVAEAVDVLEHDIGTLLAERDSFKDIVLRLQADFENYRKRAAGQQQDEIDRATGKIAESRCPCSTRARRRSLTARRVSSRSGLR